METKGKRRASPRAAYSSPNSPDRFIPRREFDHHKATSYRVSKHPRQLSPREKAARKRLDWEDPFLPSSGQPAEFYVPAPGRTLPPQLPHHRSQLVADADELSGSLPAHPLRNASAGNAWGVGGASASIGQPATADPDVSPHVSGQNPAASSFVAKFLPLSSPRGDTLRHESRLALALDFDQTTKVLETRTVGHETTPSPTSPDHERYSPFIWKDGAWKKAGKGHCKGFSTFLPNRFPCLVTSLPFPPDDIHVKLNSKDCSCYIPFIRNLGKHPRNEHMTDESQNSCNLTYDTN